MAFFSVFLLPPTKKHNIQSLPILDFLKVLFKYCPYSILPYCSFFFFLLSLSQTVYLISFNLQMGNTNAKALYATQLCTSRTDTLLLIKGP